MTNEPDNQFPRHGDRGLAPSDRSLLPKSLTVAISRQAGARGNSIARRLARRLGWPIYDEELLNFMAQDDISASVETSALPKSAHGWVSDYFDHLVTTKCVQGDETFLGLVRVLLGLAAVGEVIIVGRGAGYLLPAQTTLHVRIVAPISERIGYFCQWQRLTEEAALAEVTRRDKQRAEFVAAHYPFAADGLESFDLCLNSSRLGEERCTELIAAAVKLKLSPFGTHHTELTF